MSTLIERMIGAAKLDVNTYEEVEADVNATGQAMIVVVVSSLAAGLGAIRAMGVMGLVWGALAALIGWFIWAGLTYLIGTKLLPEPQTEADIGQLLRTIGFASSPGVLRVLAILPWIGWVISFLIAIWMLVATVIAVRQALDYKSTGRAVGVCVIGFIVYMIVMWVVMGLLGGAGMMMGMG